MNEIIKYYSKTPPNKFKMENATIAYKEENRSCSDTLEVYLKIENDKITDFSFEGITSIITTATASVFGESIVGMDLNEILKKDYSYIVELIGEEVSPRRQKSSVLGILATKNAIHKYLKDGKNEDILDLLNKF